MVLEDVAKVVVDLKKKKLSDLTWRLRSQIGQESSGDRDRVA